MYRSRLAALAVSALLCAVPAAAATVYQNGEANRIGGSDMAGPIQAHDFRLAAPAAVTGATFYALDFGSGVQSLPLSYFFFSDSLGLPGDLLASGVVAAPTVTPLGPQGGFGDPEYRVTFLFSQAISLSAGVDYWFGLRFGDGSDDSLSIFWANVDGNNTALGALLTPQGWSASVNEASFSLQAGTGGGSVVPEPASWAMLIAGFGLVGLSARRRRTACTLG